MATSSSSCARRRPESSDSNRRSPESTPEFRSCSAETKENAAPVGFEPIVPGWLFFWFFAIALTVVEFFANFPVFRLLLPLKPALAKAAEDAAQDTISADWWAGLALQMKEIVLHADALFVALVAVLFLILFGKTIGGSARVLVALRPKDQPLAATTIRSIRRQHLDRADRRQCIGVAAVLTFLYLSRGSIASVAASRVTADSLELQRLKSEAQQIPPGDLGAMARSAAAIREQTRTLEIHRDDRAYATTVQNNNTPLFFLNLGLVFGAAVLGFLTYRQIVRDGKTEHPAIVQLRADRRSLQADAHSAVQAGRAAESQARASIGRVEHLMTASPLAEWVAKADRLEVVIPLFRGENARLRDMDPASILAFAGKPSLSLPIVEAERGFPEPTDFARLKEEFEAMPSRLRGSHGANSDQPQRRELGMMATRLALGCASFGLALSALGCGQSAGAKAGSTADESVHRGNRSVGQSLGGGAARFAAASGQPGRIETAQRRRAGVARDVRQLGHWGSPVDRLGSTRANAGRRHADRQAEARRFQGGRASGCRGDVRSESSAEDRQHRRVRDDQSSG